MLRFSATSSAAVIAVMLLVADVTSALTCYQCDDRSSSACTSLVRYFGSTQDNCDCCRKSVDQGVTKRECVTGPSGLTSCVPSPGNVFICGTDKCNAGNRTVSRDLVSIVMAAVAAAIGLQNLR